LNESYRWFSHRYREGLLSAVSAGFFLLLVGTIFVTTPNLVDGIQKLFSADAVKWNTTVPNTEISLPAPTHPADHLVVYQAIGLFSLIWGIFLIAMLVLRFSFHSQIRKKAENAGNIAFWLGTSYLINIYLNQTNITTTTWFTFWTALLMLLGVSLIVRAAVLAALRFGT
jgi:hypothetical protein